MKDKIKSITITIIVIDVIIIALLSYPFNVSVKKGKTTCSNAFGKVVNCR